MTDPAAHSPDLWLVRTAENFVAGPYSQDQIRQLLREGQLGQQDELCVANRYWVYLHEHEEVVNLLGADVLKYLTADPEREDVTLTQTEPGATSAAAAERAANVSSILQAEAEINDGQAALAQAQETPLVPIRRGVAQSSEPLIHVSPTAESRPNWRLWIFVGLIALILVAVFAHRFLSP